MDKNSTDKAIEKYLHNIILGKSHVESVNSAFKSLKSVLLESFKELDMIKPSIYIQGSIATRTTLRPIVAENEAAEFDVDICAESTEWSLENPRSAITAIKEILDDSEYADKVQSPKSSCVPLRYADGPSGEKFHIDIVPILNHGGKRYAVVKDGDQYVWEESDPVKIINWFNSKNDQDPTFRTNYLLLKRLVQINGIKIPSILLQRLAKDCHAPRLRYLRELLDLARVIVNKLNDENYILSNPVNGDEDLRLRIPASEINKLRDLMVTVSAKIAAYSQSNDHQILVDLFSFGFPSDESHDNEVSLRIAGYHFDCDYSGKFKIEADCSHDEHVEGSEFRITVPKDFENHPDKQPTLDKLRFKLSEYVKNHNVLWQVMNDPEKVHFQVRGAYEGSNSDQNGEQGRHESVSYLGNHFVRGYVMNGDRCKFITNLFKVNVVQETES